MIASLFPSFPFFSSPCTHSKGRQDGIHPSGTQAKLGPPCQIGSHQHLELPLPRSPHRAPTNSRHRRRPMALDADLLMVGFEEEDDGDGGLSSAAPSVRGDDDEENDDDGSHDEKHRRRGSDDQPPKPHLATPGNKGSMVEVPVIVIDSEKANELAAARSGPNMESKQAPSLAQDETDFKELSLTTQLFLLLTNTRRLLSSLATQTDAPSEPVPEGPHHHPTDLLEMAFLWVLDRLGWTLQRAYLQPPGSGFKPFRTHGFWILTPPSSINSSTSSETPTVTLYILDFHFQEELFNIARPSPAFVRFATSVQPEFIGPVEDLCHMIQVLAEECEASFAAQDMPMAPWRSAEFLEEAFMRGIAEAIRTSLPCKITTLDPKVASLLAPLCNTKLGLQDE